jgi:drug/metabolite transporter (DMT)-like permease
VLAGFFYATITILGKYISGDVNPFVMCFYNFLFGTFFLVLFTRPWTLDFSIFPPRFYLLGAGIGLFGTVLPYIFYMTGLSHPVEASKVPLVASVETVVAAILGVLLFAEPMGFFKLLGIALVLASVAIINTGKADPAKGAA